MKTAIYWSGQVMATVRVTTKDVCNTLICKACFGRLSGGIPNLKNDIATLKFTSGSRNLTLYAILFDDCSIRVFFLTVLLEYIDTFS